MSPNCPNSVHFNKVDLDIYLIIFRHCSIIARSPSMNLIEAIKRVDTFKGEKCKRNLSITTNNEIIEPDASIEGIYKHIIYIYISHYITHVQSFCANAKIWQVAPALKLLWSLPKSQGSPSSDRVCPVASWPGKLRHATFGQPLPYQHSKYLEISQNISKYSKRWALVVICANCLYLGSDIAYYILLLSLEIFGGDFVPHNANQNRLIDHVSFSRAKSGTGRTG